jgi:hypothetical protein
VTYRLEGTTEDSAQVGLLPNPQLVLSSSLAEGARVTVGSDLGVVDVDPRVAAQLGSGGSETSVDRSRLAQLKSMGGKLTSPIEGEFSKRSGTPVVIGAGIDVVVSLTPIQHLRYRSFRFSGQAIVETVVGVRQVGCAAVWTEVTPIQGDDAASARLHCRLPKLVETVAGLRTRLVLATERINDAVVVLNSYIGYDLKADGYFLILSEGGGQRRLAVIVGATDGVRRIILSEVPVGATLVRPTENVIGG